MKSRICDEVKCCCCEEGVLETIEHLFIKCSMANRLWNSYASAAGVDGPLIQLKSTVHKWRLANSTPKLKILFKVVPMFILWQIWKRKNIVVHGGKMTFYRMGMEINRNLHLLARKLYPWLRNIPTSWSMMVKYFEEYTPSLNCKIVYRKPPAMGTYKCNLDGASKENPGPSSGAFCVRDGEGNLVYAECRRMEDGSNLMAEMTTLRFGLE